MNIYVIVSAVALGLFQHFEFGDVMGVMKAFRLQKPVVIVISLLLLTLALLAIMQVWYV